MPDVRLGRRRFQLLRQIQAGHPMKIITNTLILVAGLFLVGCDKPEKAAQPAQSNPSSGNPLTAPVDYLGATAKAKKAAEKTIDSAGLNQAIQLYYAQEGKYPKTLNDLVGPDYISKLPEAPAGMKFEYNPATGQLKVVSK